MATDRCRNIGNVAFAPTTGRWSSLGNLGFVGWTDRKRPLRYAPCRQSHRVGSRPKRLQWRCLYSNSRATLHDVGLGRCSQMDRWQIGLSAKSTNLSNYSKKLISQNLPKILMSKYMLKPKPKPNPPTKPTYSASSRHECRFIHIVLFFMWTNVYKFTFSIKSRSTISRTAISL